MKENKKEIEKETKFTKNTFKATYILMLIACFFVLCTGIYVTNSKKRTILGIEFAITAIASYIYSKYNDSLDTYRLTHATTLGWEGVNKLRYLDWSITTPLMLISLSLLLSMNSGIKISTPFIVTIVVLDWLMLWAGYLGETHQINRPMADIVGFVPFFVIFYMLYRTFINGKSKANIILYGVYFCIWIMYGILYMFNEKIMNTYFNILDAIAKAFVAIGISLHLIIN